MALAAATMLENGNEEQAKAELQKALNIDASSKLAQNLMRQINATDPVATLGRESFNYTVRPKDTLSGIAERFMRDKFLFYILARYNDIKVPRQVSGGQQLRIPGKPPTPPSASKPEPAAEVVKSDMDTEAPSPPVTPVAAGLPPTPAPDPAEAAPVAYAQPRPPDPPPSERALRNAQLASSRGDLDRAMAEVRRAASLDPPAPVDRIAQLQRRLVDQFTLRARSAFAKQELDACIQNWERVLELEPGNEGARLERQRAVALKQRLGQLR
jgi:tetratricopeptide (TPR) repeat protein